MVRLLTPADYCSMPWNNGAGRTMEVAAHPPGAAFDVFAWRVSAAEVDRDGPPMAVRPQAADAVALVVGVDCR